MVTTMTSIKDRDDRWKIPLVETSTTQPSRVRFTKEDEFIDQTLSIFRKPHHDAPEQALPTQSLKTFPPSPILSHKTKSKAYLSVFERLSNTETVASLHQKISPTKQEEIKNHNGVSKRMIKRATSAPPKIRTKTLKQKDEIRRSKSSDPNCSPTSIRKKSLKIMQQNSIDRLANNHITKTLKHNDEIRGIRSSDLNSSPTSSRKKSLKIVQQDSFDRLANNHTNKNLEKKDETREGKSSNLNYSPTSKTSKRSLKIVQQDSFDRLANNHTALSRSRRIISMEKQDKPRSNRSNSLGRRRSLRKKPHLNSRYTSNRRTIKNQRIIHVNDTLGEAFDVQSAGPPLEIEFSSKMKILCSHKSTPESGFEELDSFDLGLNSYLSEYAAGFITAKQFGSEIMCALLWRDLPSSNMKWNIRQTLERELAMPLGEIGYSIIYDASGRCINDEDDEDAELINESKDDPFTASVTGNVVFTPDNEIHVENYVCIHDVK